MSGDSNIIANFLVLNITVGFRKRMDVDFRKILEVHRVTHPATVDKYCHGGKYYSTRFQDYISDVSYGGITTAQHVVSLSDAAIPFHLEWLKEWEEFLIDRNRIVQTMASMIQRYPLAQDIRDMFPDGVTHGTEFDKHPRTRISCCSFTNPEDEIIKVWGVPMLKFYNRINASVATYAGQNLL